MKFLNHWADESDQKLQEKIEDDDGGLEDPFMVERPEIDPAFHVCLLK